MAASDVFVNTSLDEGMSGRSWKPWLKGFPSWPAPSKETVPLSADGENGLLFPVNERDELIKAAIRLARINPFEKGWERGKTHCRSAPFRSTWSWTV